MAVTPPVSPAKPLDQRVLQTPGGVLFSWMSPQDCAIARGVLIAAIIAAIGFIVASIQSGAIVFPPEYAWISSCIVVVLQAVVGALDSHSVEKTTKALASRERLAEAAKQAKLADAAARNDAAPSQPMNTTPPGGMTR